MSEIERMRRRFAWDDWANRRVFEASNGPPEPCVAALRWLGHAVVARQVWLERIEGDDRSTDFWPALSPPALAGRIGDVAGAWARFLAGRMDSELEAAMRYRNSSGAWFENSLRDTLEHVLTHGAYHRGQANQAIRAAGGEPARVDYIVFVREER